MGRTTTKKKAQAGFSLVEMLIAAALIALVFGGLFAGVRLMIVVITHSKAEAGARSLAVERLEYIRSLDYDAVGTQGGLVPGPLAQNATTSLNGIEYSMRTVVNYIDRVQDGFGEVDDTIPGIPADENGITEDSKVVKVEMTWTLRSDTRSLSFSTDIIPRGVESTAGGGTLRIIVFDADVEPVEGAEIHIYNENFSPAIDTVVYTNALGMANFPGAPAAAAYQIRATKAGYSTDQTYSVTATNTSPTRTHISVATGTVSTVNFQIDLLSDLTIKTVGEPTRITYFDTFSSDNDVASSSETTVSGGGVTLSGGAGSYAATGTIFATTTIPSAIDFWESLDFTGTTSASTDLRVHLYSVALVGSTTEYTLVPDADLPGNESGFTAGPVNITALPSGAYDELALGATLSTTDANETPELYEWELVYVEAQSPIGSIPFTIAGAKSIGTFMGAPVLKYSGSDSTDAGGSVTVSDLEFDDYTVTPTTGSYTVREVYGGNPHYLAPNSSDTITFVLGAPTTYSLRVQVENADNDPIGGATVRLYDGGYDETESTSIYGQTFFGSGLSASPTYTIEVSAGGYDPVSVENFEIAGNESISIELPLLGSGEEEGPTGPTTTSNYLPGYDTRIPLSISDTVLFGNVSDFPVYVDLASLPSSFFNLVQGDGDDIRVTEEDGLSEIPFELVAINTVGESGQLHFKAPSLTTATTSTFYIYYGSTTASGYSDTHVYGAENVWTNNYRAVYHLEEAQAGTGASDLYQDSTANNAHGDDDIQASGKEGKLGLGQEFNNWYTDNIELPYTVLDGQTDVTLSFWYRTNTDDYMSVLSGARDNSSNGANEYLLWFQDRNDVQFFSHGDPRVNFDIFNIDDNNYRYYVSVRDDGNNQTRFYINANQDNQSPANDSMGTLDIAPGGLFIGVDQDSIGGSFDQELDGELDELRISSVVRSSTWISNEYLNQNAPNTFYSIGSVETE